MYIVHLYKYVSNFATIIGEYSCVVYCSRESGFNTNW